MVSIGALFSDVQVCDVIQPLPTVSSCLTDEDSFLSGFSDWKADRQEENCPFLRAYCESGAVVLILPPNCFDSSNSASQLPYDMGLLSTIS